MSHLPPNAAIFSPSVARAAASAAKDWSYIDSWLSQKYASLPTGPPQFERNADTLRALLALASANEAADEQRQLLARLEADALRELQAQYQTHAEEDNDDENDDGGDDPDPLTSARLAILTSLTNALTRDGATALTALASSAVALGISSNPTPQAIGKKLLSLSAETSSLSQTSSRLDALSSYIDQESTLTTSLIGDLQQESYRPSASLAKENLETQRKIKAMASRLPELRDKAAALAQTIGTPNPTIEQVRREEEAYTALLATKKELDAQVRSFQGLPPDMDQARQELESLRTELRQLTQRRDAVFEGLVERETPRKPSRLP
ncbi:hypothetical protein B0T22DRAFT_184331 [Podospora appendiculata]|uniref:HAUS augmin-like complex subunit 1 n=1 Tax=Podospora appendiculata TaxID=314037 RepID=A0AAE1CDX3_9PEZI|nr:hypothetical protein B0T22DRAFT_184331 [Podospora appendiculata]